MYKYNHEEINESLDAEIQNEKYLVVSNYSCTFKSVIEIKHVNNNNMMSITKKC